MKNRSRTHSFAITPLILRVIFIAIVLAGYYYILNKGYFPEWIDYIYIGVKIIIAYQVIVGASQTLLIPLLALAIGLVNLFTIQIYHITLISPADAWQLIIAAVIGFIIAIIIKL